MAGLPKVTKRRDFIQKLKNLGYDGPYTGTGRHPQYMIRGRQKIKIPNPHEGDMDVDLLSRILKNAAISKDDWNAA